VGTFGGQNRGLQTGHGQPDRFYFKNAIASLEKLDRARSLDEEWEIRSQLERVHLAGNRVNALLLLPEASLRTRAEPRVVVSGAQHLSEFHNAPIRMGAVPDAVFDRSHGSGKAGTRL
jgi:hypothetical protein